MWPQRERAPLGFRAIDLRMSCPRPRWMQLDSHFHRVAVQLRATLIARLIINGQRFPQVPQSRRPAPTSTEIGLTLRYVIESAAELLRLLGCRDIQPLFPELLAAADDHLVCSLSPLANTRLQLGITFQVSPLLMCWASLLRFRLHMVRTIMLPKAL